MTNETAAIDRTPAPLVAFDFDGTLTVRDSYTSFLLWRAGPTGALLRAIRLAPAAISWLFHRDRGRIKAAATRAFLGGATRDELEADAKAFAGHVSRRLLRPDAIIAWKRWRNDDVRLIIVTASPTFVVAPFARGLGADGIIGTELAFDALGRATGGFNGPNCRGPEKVARIHATFGPEVVIRAAYGDTSGDTEMLAAADEPYYRVFTGRP
jgi:phosphatidylglycerophosphatase C